MKYADPALATERGQRDPMEVIVVSPLPNADI